MIVNPSLDRLSNWAYADIYYWGFANSQLVQVHARMPGGCPVVAVLRSSIFMPPVRWMRFLTPPPESLGQALRRLRTERRLDQEDVSEALGIGNSSLSNYENDKYAPPREALQRLNEYFDLPPNTLRTILKNYEDWRELQEPIPGPSVAVPNEPELIEAVEALFLFEPEQLSDVAQHIRLIAKGPIPRPVEEETG